MAVNDSRNVQISALGVKVHSSPQPADSELLAIYLSMPPSKREEVFASTAVAACRIGVSQRTIQAWIDAGFIAAVPIGNKFQVYLASLVDYLRIQASRRGG